MMCSASGPGLVLLQIFIFYHSFQCGECNHDWSYKEELGNGPSKWVETYPKCGGDSQSSVDIVNPVDNEDLEPLVFTDYDKILANAVLINSGLKAQFFSDSKPSVTGGCLGTDTYDFSEFHFHWGSDDTLGSEHAVNGHHYPMEGHILSINRKYGSKPEALKHPDGIAILGTFYESTSVADDSFDPVIKAVKEASQKEINETIKLDPSLAVQILLPKNTDSYYCYNGSLETPGCEEAVIWTLFKEPHPLSSDQIAEFRNLRFEDGTPMVNNFRPLQPLNGRTIYSHGCA